MKENIIKFFEKTYERLLESGAKPVLGSNAFNSHIPNEYEVKSLTPETSVLVKKKAFSTLGFNNDLRWMDATEKLLLRATKALFAYKVQQIKVLESITKYNNVQSKTGAENLSLLAYILNESSLLTYDISEYQKEFSEVLSQSKEKYSSLNYEKVSPQLKDIFDLTKRLAFSENFYTTTWHIDPASPENLIVGPGTGVMEITNYSSLTVSSSIDSSPSGLSLSMEDPNNLATITEHDIEYAISEALHGAHGFFEKLLEGSIAMTQRGKVGSIKTELSELSRRFNDSTKNNIGSDEHYIRNRLRTFYLGKTITNPGDGVNIFISSNKRFTTGGNFSSKNQIYDESMGVSDIVIEAERRLFTSGEMSFDKYKKFRELSPKSFSMFHVFGGYVTDSSSSYSGGKYTFSFNAKDNMAWLTWSNYQKVPALEDIVGVLEDPLTPYKVDVDEFGTIKTDGAPELLDENKELLENDFLSYKSGILKGQQAREDNLYQGQFNGFGSLDKTKIMQHADGFIYRWKSGIVTATASLQTANESGSSARANKLMAQKYGITPADELLANLDVANIISVLVTGQPYNIDTFISKSFEAATGRSGGSNQLKPDDPLSFLIQSIKKQNAYYGNFKPYRTVSMNKRTVSRTLRDKIERDNLNSKIVKLQKRKIELSNTLSSISDSLPELAAQITAEIDQVSSEIQSEISALKRSTFGSTDTDLKFNFLFSNNPVNDGTPEEDERIKRAMLHVGSLRRIEDVRMNRDNNYLIISDQYDYNLELTPFLLKLSQSNYKRFQGDYTNVYDRCQAANSAIGFEFFTNTQGHLEFRPPQWNKTPYTILQHAAKARKEGKPVIPENIMSLFEKRIDNLKYEIQKYNVLIAMAALLIYKFPDRKLLPGFKGINGPKSLNFFGIKSGKLKKDNKKDPGNKTGRSPFTLGSTISIDFAGDKGSVLFGDISTLIGEFDPLIQEEFGILNDTVSGVRSLGQGTGDAFSDDNILSIATAVNLNYIRSEARKLLGFDPSKDLGLDASRDIEEKDFPFSNVLNQGTLSGIQLEKILLDEKDGMFKKIGVFVSARDRLVTIYKRNLEKKNELQDVNELFENPYRAKFISEGGNPEDLDPESENINNKLISTDALEKALENVNKVSNLINGKSFEGSLFEHLIEDDTSNILGFGSSKRFIINDSDIIQASFQETPPEFTRINVVGDVPLNVASGLNSATDGLYFWAGASDFDLWRQYGYKPKTLNSVPFLSDAENGCKPYAYFQMQTQRAKIITANITVVGNEFYQPGDVVYVKSKNLLYYVESLSHSLTIGGSFSTSLKLIFGHAPGEYLPGPLDVIGQQLSTSPLKDKILTNRSLRGDDNYQPFRPSTLIMPNVVSRFGAGISKRNVLRYADNQSRFAKIISDAGLVVSGKKRFLLLRAFISDSPSNAPEGSALVREAEQYLSVVKSMFTNPEFLTRGGGDEINLDLGSISDGSFVSDAYNSIIEAADGALKQAFLPNGYAATPVQESSIILQICYLKKDKVQREPESGRDNASVGSGSKKPSGLGRNNRDSVKRELPDLNIKCFDKDLINFLTDKGGEINNEAFDIFPKDGPRQESWMDFRLLGETLVSGKVLNFVEIGLLDINLD